MASRVVRFLRNLLTAATIAGAATWLISLCWLAIGGGDLPLHGWIALLIGSFGTVGLAWALMGLAFRSHREGWDDRVDNSLDPGRDGHDADDRP
ncbi:MAG TPA: hypothetical protein VFF48_09285 [Brevundimonas sp.]|nr:hypothetical protein [Brevundimonas sp.]